MPAEVEAPSDQERLCAAIGPRADYYLRRWREMDEAGKAFSWNWAACFANLFWLAYRKMWLALAGFILANILVGIIGAAIPALNRYTIVLMVLLTFVTGAYGNLLYRRQTEKLAASGASLEQLRARGGTSPLALGIALALTVAGAALVAVSAVQQMKAQRA